MTHQEPKFETNLPLGVHIKGHVSFDWNVIGEVLVNQSSAEQAEFFRGFTQRLNLWPISDRLSQVYFIADAVRRTGEQKKLAKFLRDLATALDDEE